MIRKALLAAAVTLLLAPPVYAGAGFGPQVGYYNASGADQGEYLFGAALRLRPVPFLGIEGSINYRQESYYDDALEVKSWPVMVTGLIYPLPIVYGLAGGGWYNTTFKYTTAWESETFPGGSYEETSNEFGWHVGGGVEVPLGQAVHLAGDVRYVFLDYNLEESNDAGEQPSSDFYVLTLSLLLGRQ